METPIYYNFSQVNDTDSEALLYQTDVRLTPILSKANKYKLQIVKFTLPADAIDTFVIEDSNSSSNEYAITYSLEGNGPVGTPAYTTYSVSQPLYTRSEYRMFSVSDFCNNFNRASAKAHVNLLDSMVTDYVTRQNITGAGSFNLPGTTNTHDISFTINGFQSGVKLAAIKLSGTITPTTAQIYELQLISPNGSRNIICAAKKFNGSSMSFDDGSIRSITNEASFVSGNYYPHEAFIAHNSATTSVNGIWILRIVNRNRGTSQLFAASHNLTLSIYGSPKVNSNTIGDPGNDSFYPRIPPTIDADGGSLVLTYDQNMLRSGFRMAITPKLYRILGFKGIKFGANYIIELPQTINSSDTTLNIVNYKQPNPTAYRMLDLSEVIIKSDTLPVSGETNSVDNSSIIMSINTSSADLNPSIYEFATSNVDDRSYSLTNNQPISRLNFSVNIRYRASNTIVPAYLAPFSVFNMLIKFAPH